MKNTKQPKVALVCDWLTGIGGAERVVLELHKMYPDAPIYTSQYDSSKIDWFKNADVRTGWLQKLPVGLKKFLPVLRAWYFSHLDLSEYDLIISETGAEAKAIKFGKNARHVCICNTPTHYYWSRYESYLQDPGFPTGLNWLARLGLRLFVAPMRRWDLKAAQKPTELIAISSHIQKQVKKYYKRDSVVVFPPVNLDRFKSTESKPRNGFIVTGRQTPYKKIGLAVLACTKLDLPLTVVGSGPEHKELVKMAGPTIKFDTNANDQDVVNHLQTAKAFIFPGVDDFGIAPVEAMAAGTPVIAFKAGGALDYVIPGTTGEFLEKQTTASLVKTLRSFNSNKYNSAEIIKSTERFSEERFKRSLQDLVK